MPEKFKPVKFDELKLSTADMRKIAAGARIYMQPEVEDETETTNSPEELVSRRPIKES